MAINPEIIEIYNRQQKQKQKQAKRKEIFASGNNGRAYYDELYAIRREYQVEKAYKEGRLDKEMSPLLERIGTYGSNYDNYVNEYYKRYGIDPNDPESAKIAYDQNSYRDTNDTQSWLDTVTSRRDEMAKEANAIKRELEFYEPYIDGGFYGNTVKMFDNYGADLDSIVDASATDHEHWSKWDSEDAYVDSYYNNLFRQKYADVKTPSDLLAAQDAFKKEYSNNPDSDVLRRESDFLENLKFYINQEAAILDWNLEEELEKLEEYANNNLIAENAYERLGLVNGLSKDELLSIQDNGVIRVGGRQKDPLAIKDIAIQPTHTYDAPTLEIKYDPLFDYENEKQKILQKDAEYAVYKMEAVADPNSAGYDQEFSAYAVDTGDENWENKLSNIRNIEDSEKHIARYYYNKYGKDKAEEYLDTIEYKLKVRNADEFMEWFTDAPTFVKVGASVPVGLDQFVSGAKGIFKDEYDPSTLSIIGSKIDEDLADEWTGIKILGKSLAQTAYNAGTSAANMLPSTLLSLAVEAALPTVGEGAAVFAGLTGAQIAAGAGTLTLGASAMGNAKQEMLSMGYSVGQANAYGLMVGASEAGLSYFLSGIPGLRGSDGVFSALGEKALTKVNNAIARAAITMGGNMADEALEEGLQTVMESWFKGIVTEDFENPDIDEILYSSLLGALTAGGIGGAKLAAGASVNAVNNAINTSKVGKSFIKQNGQSGVSALTAQGLSLNQDTAAYKQAAKVQSKIDSGKNASRYSVGKLYTSMSESQTSTAVQTRLSAHIENKTEVRKLSNTITDILYGREVSNKAIKTLAANKYALNTLNDVLGSNLNKGATVSDVRTAVKSYQEAGKGKSGANASTKAQQGSASKIPGRGDIQFAAEKNADGGYDVVGTKGGDRAVFGSFKSQKQAQAAVYAYTLGMGAEGLHGLVTLSENLPDGVDLGEAALAFNAFYNQGKNGKAFSAAKNMEFLSPEQRQYAYNLGIMDKALDSARAKREGGSPPASDVQNSSSLTQHDGTPAGAAADRTKPAFLDNDKVEKAQSKVDAAKQTDGTKKKGTVIYDGDRSKLSDMQRKSLDILDKVANALGVTFHIYESKLVNGKYVYKKPDGVKTNANGWYDPKTGEIWLDINAGNNGEGVVIFTAAHELTHFIKQWSPKKFKLFADFLIDQYYDHNIDIDELVQRQVDKAKKNGRDISYDEAYEEVIADSCESFLRDSNAIERIAELNQKDANLADKIKQFIGNMLKRLRELMSGMDPQSDEGKIVSEMTSALEQLHQLWTDALIDAGEAYSGAESIDNSFSNDKLSDRDYSYDNLSSSDYYQNGHIYSYEFLTAQKDMIAVELPQTGILSDGDGKIDDSKVISMGVKNAGSEGVVRDGKIYVRNAYTGRELRIDNSTIKHGLDGTFKRHLTNARIGSVIGSVVKNAIPINGLKNTANKAVGTYAMVAYCNDSQNREFIAVITVEQHSGEVDSFELYDVAHAVSGRQKKGSQVDTKSQGVYPIKATTISIPHLIEIVKSTHQSILSDDVLSNLGEVRNPQGSYADKVLFSDRDPDTLTNREILAHLLETEDMTPSEKGFLTKYKNKLSSIETSEAEIAKMEAELKELRKKGKKDSSRAITLEGKIETRKKELSRDERLILNLEATKPIRELLKREIDSAYKKAAAEGKEKLAEYKERVKAREERIKQERREMRERATDRRHSSEIKGKIKAFKEKLQRTLRHPTDRKYIPGALAQAMIDVCELIDTDTELYKADGSINKAQERREKTRESLRLLRTEYNNIKNDADPLYADEFDKDIAAYLDTLEGEFSGKSLDEMSRSELEEMYKILHSIDGTLREARKLIGEKENADVYEAGDVIISEQKKIAGKRKSGKRSIVQKANDGLANQSLSPVRRVLEICGYDRNSPLYKLFKDFEKGVREAHFFEMGAKKSFEALTTGKNTKTYENAVYKADGGNKYTDVNGRRFGISKMQKMQAILSFEREVANKRTHHIEKGGFVFADLKELSKGKLKTAIDAEHSHKVTGSEAVKLVEQFKQELEGDRWAQDYMAASRIFFNETAKNAINDTYMKLKHRILATDLAYIPFEVDRNSIVREISAKYDIQETISSYGMLQEMQSGASNALIMTGLNNMLDRHIEQVSTIHGLAVPIRNFNKVWNVRSADGSTSVKEQVQATAGSGSTKLVEQTVMDIQGERAKQLPSWYQKVKSNYIGAQFFWNTSVILKQIGSLFSSVTMLNYRGPVRMMANLGVTAIRHKKIAAEVDKYTATAWMRRQGLSDAELESLSTQKRRTWFGKVIKSGSKGMIWMDHMVALSLWKYAKQDVAKKTGLRGEALLKATAEFYDEVIENTQSMSDVLHRPEIQRGGGIGSELLGTFKTDLYQNAGNLRMAVGEFTHNKTPENAKRVVKTISSIMTSALWASMVTSIIAALRYKVDRYRDEEDDELTAESWLKVQGADLVEELFGYVFPLFGSEVAGIFRSGSSFGQPAVSSISYDAVNDLVEAISPVFSDEDEIEYEKIIVACGNFLGLPTNSAIRTLKAIGMHTEDFFNGEPLSFNAGYYSSTKISKTDKLYRAMMNDDKDRVEEITAQFDGESEVTSAIKKAIREKDPRVQEAIEAVLNYNSNTYYSLRDEIVEEGHFDFKTVKNAFEDEIEYVNRKLKEAREAKKEGDLEEYEDIIDSLIERGYSEEFIERKLGN